MFYDAVADPYCHPGPTVLKNRLGLRDHAQLVSFTVLALQAGYPLDLEALDPEAFLAAMVGSFRGEEAALADAIAGLVGR